MSSKVTILIAAGLAVAFVLVSDAQNARSGTSSEKRKPVMMTRLYTGPDGQTHAQEMEAKFTAGNTNEVFKLMAITGAELHRAAPGTVIDCHTAPRRQYVITLSGQGEIEVAGERSSRWGPDISTWSKTRLARVTSPELLAMRIA
jgi:quercetin dioxygenase-like cupin family protein